MGTDGGAGAEFGRERVLGERSGRPEVRQEGWSGTKGERCPGNTHGKGDEHDGKRAWGNGPIKNEWEIRKSSW